MKDAAKTMAKMMGHILVNIVQRHYTAFNAFTLLENICRGNPSFRFQLDLTNTCSKLSRGSIRVEVSVAIAKSQHS